MTGHTMTTRNLLMSRRGLLMALTVAGGAAALVGCSDEVPEGAGQGPETPGNNNTVNNNTGNNEDDLFEDFPECNFRDNPEDCEGWRCYEDARGRVCEQSSPDRPDGRDGWVCDDDAQPGYTTCVREDDAGGSGSRWRCRDGPDGSRICTSDDPGGDGEWECVYTEEGVDCTRDDFPGGGGRDWDCYDDDTGTHCQSDDPANANDDPGGGDWVCRNDGDTRICDDDHDDDEPGQSRDNPDGGPGWTCFNDVDGRHCHQDDPGGGPGPQGPDGGYDTPDGSADWDCVTRNGERECTASDDPDGGEGDWDCYYDDANSRTVCTDEPDEPTDDPGWECYEADEQRICVDDNPEDPGDPDLTDCGDPTGNINGRVCAPSGDFWIVGATVSVSWTDCNGQTQTVQTQTDAEGYFVLVGVKTGTYDVHVEKGPYQADYSVVVRAGETTTIPMGDFCFDQSTNIAVVTGQFDQVEVVLDQLGFTYTLFAGYPNNDEARGLLGSLARLNEFDVVFMNCGTAFRGIFDDPRVLDAVRSNLEAYVSQGGRLYVSDWDWLFIEEPFPDAIDYVGTDKSMFEVLQGATGLRQAEVVDAELLAVLGESRVTLDFDYPEWAIVQSVSSEARVFLRGNVQTVRGGLVNDVPLLMSFPYGEGEVIFTSYHIHRNEAINDIFTFTVLGFN